MNKLLSFVKEFTKDNIPEIDLIEKKGKQYFYIEEEQKIARNKINSSSKLEPFSQGIFFGEITDHGFRPSFPFLEIIAHHTIDAKKAVLDERFQTIFLYKNNIFDESIKKKPTEAGLVIVENEKGEVLGYAEAKIDKNNKVMLNHRMDRSNYLKREN